MYLNEKIMRTVLKNIGKGIYNVESGDDDCLLTLGYFLTDQGSPDQFKSWIESTHKGEITGKNIFVAKDGDEVKIALTPAITNKECNFVANKFDILRLISWYNQLIADKPAYILVERENGKIGNIKLESKHSGFEH